MCIGLDQPIRYQDQAPYTAVKEEDLHTENLDTKHHLVVARATQQDVPLQFRGHEIRASKPE